MEQHFSRKTTLGIKLIIFGTLILIGGLRHNEYRLIPEFLYYIGSGTFFIFSLWLFFVPYITIDDKNIIIKKSPLEKHEITIKEITNVVLSDDEIKVSESSEYTLISLKLLSHDDKNEFIKILTKMSPVK